MDTIGDFFTIIRNALKARKRVIEVPASKLKKEITKILYDQGYILNYKFEPGIGNQETIKIALKYTHASGKAGGEPVIKRIGRISRPGLRRYEGWQNIPRSANGLGIVMVSTSKGVLTDKEARRLRVGGEIIGYVV